MSFNTILKRATSFLRFTSEEESHLNYEDGDIVYCKNNVCVHTPSQHRAEGSSVHHPGYMVVKCQAVVSDNKSLTLSWIPNERLRRNHDLIYNGSKNEEDTQRFSCHSENDSDTHRISSVVIPELNKPEDISEEQQDEHTCSMPLDIKSEQSQTCSSGSLNEKSKEILDDDNDSGIATKSSSCLTVTTISDESNQSSPDGDRFTEERSSKAPEEESLRVSTSDIESSNVTVQEQNEGEGTNDGSLSNKSNIDDHLLENLSINEEALNPVEDLPSIHEELYPIEDIAPIHEEELNSVEDLPSKHRYISSSESSSESGKQTEHTEAESSFQVETNNSEDEISLGSSTDLQASPPPRYFSSKARDQWYDRSAESMAISANLAFPESPSTISSLCPTPVEGGSSPVRRLHKCGIFSVDLGQMKSLRLFFSDKEKTCGQLVIASQESQYKILHFHHGGLDKLASVFEDWNFLVNPMEKNYKADIDSPTDPALKQFSVCRPEIEDDERHPEEGTVPYLDADKWVTYFSEDGVIEDDLSLRRTIFFGGVEPQLRTNVWPFLLHYYDIRTTFLERQAVMEEKHQLYSRINTARENMSPEEKERFWKSVQCTVEKDVVRTDRSKPCFAGPNNPNIEKMKNILLNFAYFNSEIGYTQGMSDILAPILAEVRNEADVFWCFTGMMSKTIFVTSPRDQDMEKNLKYLGELLRLMVPSFYNYVKLQDDGLDLLFCHRWILLCFKREFSEDEALAMWEACWSNYQTDYFHLFLVVAIIAIYGEEVSQQQMRPDEMLLYFTSLANHMDGNLVLQKARGLLHQFRSKERIPCTLVGLCELCGPGMWDSGHAPTVVCSDHAGDHTLCQAAPSAVLNYSCGSQEQEKQNSSQM